MRTDHRAEFIARLTRELSDVPPHRVAILARALMSKARTLQRLAEAQCNGDYPADNGERDTVECPECNTYWAPQALKGTPKRCPDCRTSAQVRALVAEFPQIVPEFGGDPRGYVLVLKTQSGQSNRFAGEGLGVPS